MEVGESTSFVEARILWISEESYTVPTNFLTFSEQQSSMVLTVCIGASGSGKTTFIDDVHDRHHCIYVRQYHSMRPFIVVDNIPNFDPTQLPFWDVYQNEGVDHKIKAGGTLAGKYTRGLSGGQRKLLLFELIYQRTKTQSDLLIVLDEPFSGVTDDFVPFIKRRLREMSQSQNIVLVTNDHVDTLTEMSDNVITVSAVDRTTVKINQREKVDREEAILSLALGQKFVFTRSSEDLRFFVITEILSSGQLLQMFIFALFSFSLYIATFWDSSPTSAPLVLIAGGIIAFFQINPYLLGLVEWRDCMLEESEALVHSSATMNMVLKIVMTLTLIVLLAAVEYGVVNLVIDGLFLEPRYWAAMLCDAGSLQLPLVCLGLFTRLPFQTVQLVGSLPFLLMVFFSTTFSPGAGVAILKELRYLFPRFYFWCMVPGIEQNMEECPDSDIIVLYMVLSAFTGVFVVFSILGLTCAIRACRRKQASKKRANMWEESRDLQVEMYGEEAVKRLRDRRLQENNMVNEGTSKGTPGEEATHQSQQSSGSAGSPNENLQKSDNNV